MLVFFKISKWCYLKEFEAKIINPIYKITQQQLENIFIDLENRIRWWIIEDGFNLESEECEFYYIKTLKMTFLYTIFNLLLS